MADQRAASLLIDPFESYPDGLSCRWVKVYHLGLDVIEIHYDAYLPTDDTPEFMHPLRVQRVTVAERDHVVRLYPR